MGGLMIIVDIVAGLAFGTLSGMGVGGAGLLVIYLTMFRGLGQHDAQGVNLYFFIFASAAAVLIHAAKRKIDTETMLLSLLGGLPTAFLGCFAASAVHPDMLRRVFGGMLILTGLVSFFRQLRASHMPGRARLR